MATNYPEALDVLVNPAPADTTDSATVPHSGQHANANDAIEALQIKVGTTAQSNARVHVGATAPTGAGPYVWWEIDSDDNMTCWIEDGT